MTDAPLALDHAGLTCADLEAALRFYRDLLGLDVRARGASRVAAAGATGSLFLWADLELADGRVIELIQPLGAHLDPLPPGTLRPGSSHIGLRVADLGATLARLARAGVEPLSPPAEMTEPGAWQGCWIAYVRDPDGHAIELVQHPSEAR